ncbi:PolB1-binding protein PBP2 family protein [Desulfurococcus amylolyticus]|uniref:PolB1-binding protein PBP2 family protein n=1 Tax=Desulfurococcus amylolyticus TaxID=94694 RepID=UPI0009FC9CED|nr:hypothetical protein [Desulfurococcus amylolyticus]
MSSQNNNNTDINKGINRLRSLSRLERIIVNYFLRHISAGDIIAVLDIREEVKKKIREGDRDLLPETEDTLIEVEVRRVLAELVREGILYHRNGVYSLSPWLVELVKKKFGRLRPGEFKPLEKLLE